MSPIYPHDCDNCIYLGNYKGKEDLYFCPQEGMPTVISRYGEGENYMSGIESAKYFPELRLAVKLAKERGLL